MPNPKFEPEQVQTTSETPYGCMTCGKAFPTHAAFQDHYLREKHCKVAVLDDSLTDPDWEGTCENCGETPIVPITGLCGPCTWGDASTVGGNW